MNPNKRKLELLSVIITCIIGLSVEISRTGQAAPPQCIFPSKEQIDTYAGMYNIDSDFARFVLTRRMNKIK